MECKACMGTCVSVCIRGAPFRAEFPLCNAKAETVTRIMGL